MRKIMPRVMVVAAAVFAIGFDVSTAQAAAAVPAGLELGSIEICKVVTIFDIVIFEYDCYTA